MTVALHWRGSMQFLPREYQGYDVYIVERTAGKFIPYFTWKLEVLFPPQ